MKLNTTDAAAHPVADVPLHEAGPVTGYVERREARDIIGWAQYSGEPGQAVVLQLEINGQAGPVFAADLPRQDVMATGFKRLRCGFFLTLPADLPEGEAHVLRVLVQGTGQLLVGGEIRLEPGDLPPPRSGCRSAHGPGGCGRDRCTLRAGRYHGPGRTAECRRGKRLGAGQPRSRQGGRSLRFR